MELLKNTELDNGKLQSLPYILLRKQPSLPKNVYFRARLLLMYILLILQL